MEKQFIRKTTAVVAAAGALTLAGCGDNPEIFYGEPGIVRSHEYDDPDTFTTLISTGKTVIPVVHHDPEHYFLHVEQCGHEAYKDEHPDGCTIFKIEVNESAYENYADGATIIFQR